jgi:arsenate reductase-like glutaredoxin family protein
MNWKPIKKWLEDRADCEYVFNDIDCNPQPNDCMRALCMIEDWQNGYPITEDDCITEVLEILENEPDRDEYETIIWELNKRYFDIMNAKESKYDQVNRDTI